MDTREIYERIVKASNQATQRAIAAAAGVTPQTVNGWKTGKNAITIDSLENLSKAYGCTMAQLLGEKPQSDLSPASIIDYLCDMRKQYGFCIIANERINNGSPELNIILNYDPSLPFIDERFEKIHEYFVEEEQISNALMGNSDLYEKMMKIFRDHYKDSLTNSTEE